MTSLEQGNGGPTAVPLTGQQYQIDAGRYRTTVTGLRAGLRELLYDDQPLIAGYQADELPPGARAAGLHPSGHSPGHGSPPVSAASSHKIAIGLTGEPVPVGSRSGAMTHRNDQRPAAAHAWASSVNCR